MIETRMIGEVVEGTGAGLERGRRRDLVGTEIETRTRRGKQRTVFVVLIRSIQANILALVGLANRERLRKNELLERQLVRQRKLQTLLSYYLKKQDKRQQKFHSIQLRTIRLEMQTWEINSCGARRERRRGRWD